MDYKFIETVYEHIEDPDISKYEDTAYEMIRYAKEKLGDQQFSKYYFNGIMKGLRLLDQKYKNAVKCPEQDLELKQKLQSNPTSRNQCIFFAFLLSECKIALSFCYGNPYLSILNSLFRAAGLEVLVNSSIDDTILYLCLATGQKWKTWVDLQAMWNADKDLFKNGSNEEWRNLSYGEFQKRVDAGLESVDNLLMMKRTQETFLRADRKIKEIADEYEGREIKVHSITELIPEDVQKTLEDSEKRRLWYVYRMLSMVINHQIEQCVILLRRFHEETSSAAKASKEKEFRQALSRCWLKSGYKHGGGSATAVLNGRKAEELTEEGLRRDLAKYYIKAEHISRVFDASLGGCDRNVFVKAKCRYYYHFYSASGNAMMKMTYFRSVARADRILKYMAGELDKGKLSEAELKDANSIVGQKRTARPLIQFLSGKVKISKEMLLLVALFAKHQGAEAITRAYVTDHILQNCRFDMDLEDHNIFNHFFFQAFNDIEHLQDYALELEEEYLRQCKGAIFYDMIQGRELSL